MSKICYAFFIKVFLIFIVSGTNVLFLKLIVMKENNFSFLNAMELKQFQDLSSKSFISKILTAISGDPVTSRQLYAISKSNFGLLMSTIQNGERLPIFIELLLATDYEKLMKQYLINRQPSETAMDAVIEYCSVGLIQEAIKNQRFTEDQLIELVKKHGGKDFLAYVNKLEISGKFVKALKARNNQEELEIWKNNNSDQQKFFFEEKNRDYLLNLLRTREYKFSPESKEIILNDVELADAFFTGPNAVSIEVDNAIALRKKGLSGKALDNMCSRLYCPWDKIPYEDFKDDYEFFISLAKNCYSTSYFDISRIANWDDAELVKLLIEHCERRSARDYEPIFIKYGIEILEFAKEKGILPDDIRKFSTKKDTNKIIFCIEHHEKAENLFGGTSFSYGEGQLLESGNPKIAKAYITKFGICEDNEQYLANYSGDDFLEIMGIVDEKYGFKSYEGLRLQNKYASMLRARVWGKIWRAVLLFK